MRYNNYCHVCGNLICEECGHCHTKGCELYVIDYEGYTDQKMDEYNAEMGEYDKEYYKNDLNNLYRHPVE